MRGRMRVLVVGSGAREHALCWAIAASPLCDRLYCAPGNAGIAAVAECRKVAALDFDGLTRLCREERIDFVVVGPEAPLVAGLVDHLEAQGFRCFGPTAAAAKPESLQGLNKDPCPKNGNPNGTHLSTGDAESAKAEIERRGAP